MTTTENNKLIAEFMEYVHVTHYVYRIPKMAYDEPDFDNRTINVVDTFSVYFDDMKFDTDWNWLMEVVKKTREIENKSITTTFLRKELLHFVRNNHTIFDMTILDNKELVYKKIIEFIEWHNEQKLIQKPAENNTAELKN